MNPCPHHPRYQGKRRPARNCPSCWMLYSEVNPPESGRCRNCGHYRAGDERCQRCGAA